MLGSSRFGQSEAGGIERRLQALENRLNTTSTNARDRVESLGDAIASALTGWADRFRQGANTASNQSAALRGGDVVEIIHSPLPSRKS